MPSLPSRQIVTAAALLWLAGSGLRLTILAVPPVIPMIKSDLGLSATEIGILTGLPVALFALAALPGSFLIARLGPVSVAVMGLVVCALASGLRGLGHSAAPLFAATVVMGFGVAITQPAMPPLARKWLPHRIGFATAVYTNGVLVGEIVPIILTLPLVLPLVDGSWRLSLLAWGIPVIIIAAAIALLAPRSDGMESEAAAPPARWWPDWSDGLVLRLGLIFGSVNSMYFASNAFLPVYLTSAGRSELIPGALTALNFGQLPASLLLLAVAGRIAGHRWPYAVAGICSLMGVGGMVFADGPWVIGSAALLGFCAAGTFVLTLTIPPLVCAPQDVAPTAAAMFTLSYSCAVVVPIASGAMWDLTGLPACAFVPIGLCAVLLITLSLKAKFAPLRS